ncbi:MAG TPA: ABC transporter substrate-binding protein [Candidatus Binatia bacterium]|nr:ABC transporter substrate-binding protein [Candidatus Binatia bacterium]
MNPFPLKSLCENRKSPIQNPKLVGVFAIALTLAFGGAVAEAQQPAKIPRIGFLTTSPSVFPGRIKAFRQGLRDLGYVEGKNIVIEWRYTEGKLDRAPALAAELVRLKVDIIVSSGPTLTNVLKEATTTIPLVMGYHTDPVGTGLVANLARPGGNITGFSVLSPELGGKRLEILKEVVPKLFRVAVVGSSTLPGNAETLRETELAAAGFGVKLQFLNVLSPEDIEAAFRRAVNGRADALLAQGSGILNAHRTKVADLAVKSRLPGMYYAAEFVEAGGLMFYGVDFPDLHRRAAIYVDKILKGAKPADLPVEQPTKFELVINLKTAKQIGVTIPPSVLARADKVIR